MSLDRNKLISPFGPSSCEKNDNNVELSPVRTYSIPESQEIYDKFWTDFREEFENFRGTSQERISEILKLTGGHQSEQYISGKDCLDVCGGSGTYTIGLMECGAKSVTMVDGSIKTLLSLEEKINIATNMSLPKQDVGNRLTRIQADANKILNVFSEEKFDLVFIRYALHHLENPFKTISDLSKLLRPGGVLAFNSFRLGATDPCRRLLRNYFRSSDHTTAGIFEFLGLIGRIPGVDKKHEFLHFIDNDVTGIQFDTQLERIMKTLRDVSHIFGIEEVENRLSFEDFNTPYIHNVSWRVLRKFCIDMGLVPIGQFFVEATSCSQSFMLPVDGSLSDVDIPMENFNETTGEYMSNSSSIFEYLK
jgi:ubiquinone/menaquinone biosynthesis C-methylase UbiE